MDNQLKALEKRNKEKDALNATKKANEWGSQIRSYIMDHQMVKDHRTGHLTKKVDEVMNGDLDGFIMSYLKAELHGTLGSGLPEDDL